MKNTVTVAQMAIQILYPQKKILKFTRSQHDLLCEVGAVCAAIYKKKHKRPLEKIWQKEMMVVHVAGKRLVQEKRHQVACYPGYFQPTIERILKQKYQQRQAVIAQEV